MIDEHTIYVVVCENDQPIEMRSGIIEDEGGPLVFEQYTRTSDLEDIRKRAEQLSHRYGTCHIASLTFAGESYNRGKKQ